MIKVKKTLFTDLITWMIYILSSKQMEIEGHKSTISLFMSIFFYLLTNNHSSGDFLTNFASNILLLITFSLSPFDKTSAINNFAVLWHIWLASLLREIHWSFRKYIFLQSSLSLFFQLKDFFLQWTPKDFFTFMKTNVDVFVISITSVPFNIDWLANFWR